MKIAILGAGLTGALTALELVDRGCRVDLFEQNNKPLSGASAMNEGKIHLGLVYARDRSLRTARRLMRGALAFGPILCRWLPEKLFAKSLSPSFDYLVHQDSTLSPDQLAAYFDKLRDHYQLLAAEYPRGYLNQGWDEALSWQLKQRLSPAQMHQRYPGIKGRAVFRSAEKSVNVQTIAYELTKVLLHAQPHLNLCLQHRIEAVEMTASGRGGRVKYQRGDHIGWSGIYDHIINCLWHDRLRVDASAGFHNARSCYTRYKVGICFRAEALREAPIPTLTLVHGPFGDLVNFGNGQVYLSWYPVGMIGSTTALDCRAFQQQMHHRIETDGDRILSQSLQALSDIVPDRLPVDLLMHSNPVLSGGAIVAWGGTDIDDLHSQLHERSEIGLEKHPAYLTIDTGKYTQAPLLSLAAADAVRPRREIYRLPSVEMGAQKGVLAL